MSIEKILNHIKDTPKKDIDLTKFEIPKIQGNEAYIEKFILGIEEYKKTSFGDKLYYLEQKYSSNNKKRKINLRRSKNNDILGFIKMLSSFYDVAMKKERENLIKKKTSIVFDEGDISRSSQDINSLKLDINKLFSDFNKISDDVKSIEKQNNDRIFNLLLNTISILGIFVAIAFGGVGSLNVIEALPFDVKQGIPTNAFYLSLGALFVYNLLFLLFYCIFKILESFDKVRFKSFSTNFKAFIWIDAIGVIFMLSMLALVLWEI